MKIRVCTVEYETQDRNMWKATVLAYSIEEAVNFIRSKVNFGKLVSTSTNAEVDIIETKVFEDHFTKIEETVRQTPRERIVYMDSEEESCPWCKKKFKNPNTLINHIRRYHKESEE